MPEIFAPLKPEYALQIPEYPITLIGWVIWFAILVIAILHLRGKSVRFDRQALLWLALLSVLVLVVTPFGGVHLEIGYESGYEVNPIKHLMFFAAVPWLVAGGMLGVLPAALLAGMSGLLLAYLDTYNIFTPLIFMTLAVIFSWCVRQRYRTAFFQLLRFPLFAGILSLLLILPLVFLAMVLSMPDVAAVRVAVSFISLPRVILSLSGMIVIGSLVCVFFRGFIPKKWGSHTALRPAPGEISMKYRLIATVMPILLVVLIGLMVSNWVVAENTARRSLVDRLTQTSGVVADGLPVFMQTGEALIQEMAGDDRYASGSSEVVATLLVQSAQAYSFFDQFAVMDVSGEWIASYPSSSPDARVLSPNENLAVERILLGESLQSPPVLSMPDDRASQINFIAGIKDDSGQTVRILWGRTRLESNPFSHAFTNVLDSISQSGGIGQIIGEDGTILYHTDPQQVMKPYSEPLHATPTYSERVSSDGLSLMNYYQPIDEIGWAVAVSLPKQLVQVVAWEIFYPSLLISLSGMFVVMLIALMGMSPIVKDINWMKHAVKEVSTGNFDIEFPQRRLSGEMGQLSEAFKGMVRKLQARIKKQTELVSVNEQLSGHLDLNDSLHIIMMAAIERGVSAVRVVLLDRHEKGDHTKPAQCFGLGKHANMLAPLDDEILTQTLSQGVWVLRDFKIGKFLSMKKGMPYPASMIAVPLKWQDTWLGVLWVAFQEDRFPNTEIIDFFKGLSQKASLAIVNARAYDDAITTQQRMKAVLDFLPDGVLISDSNGYIIYHNQVVQTLFDAWDDSLPRKNLNNLFNAQHEGELVELLRLGERESQSKEIRLSTGKALHVMTYPILIDNRQKGQTVIFKDVTLHREQDSIKSEFVTTVSHELLSPLTLIQGYAKILQLTGNLHEQQGVYISRIIDNVEEMKSLVQNLLDMGRLESGDSLEISRFSVGDIAQRVVDSMDAQAKQKNIKMSVSLPENTLLIEADMTFITQALRNLVENAIKFTKMGGQVMLSVRENEACAVFAVNDNGIGIAPLDQRHLFEKFQRISPSIEGGQKGSGLGLAIVKSIAEHHGGKVWLESQLGKGSTFYLQIPIQLSA